MTDKLNLDHIEWCRRTFAFLRDGGSWGVPRSGLIFTKRGKRLELTARMPHDPAMPLTAEQLREQQRDDFDGSVEHFGAAGVEVVDKTGGEAR